MLKSFVDFLEGHVGGLMSLQQELLGLRQLVSNTVLNAGEAQQVLDGITASLAKLDPLIPAAKDLHAGLSEQLLTIGDSGAQEEVGEVDGGEIDPPGDTKEPADFPVKSEPQTIAAGDVGQLSGAEILGGGGTLPANAPDNETGSAPAAPPQGDNSNDSDSGKASEAVSQDPPAESSNPAAEASSAEALKNPPAST